MYDEIINLIVEELKTVKRRRETAEDQRGTLYAEERAFFFGMETSLLNLQHRVENIQQRETSQ